MRHRRLFETTCVIAGVTWSLLAPSLSFSQERWPIQQAEEKLLTGLNHQCSLQDEELAIPTEGRSMQRAVAESQYALQCQCLPGELGKLVDAQPKDARVTQDEFTALFRKSTVTCLGRTMRAKLLQMCDSPENKDVDVSERPRYCACMKRGLETVTDQQLYESSQAALRDFEARKKAILEGKPKPPPAPKDDALGSLESSCRNP